jgi:MFS transporter, AAHS family, 3-hydroxyphenylpropionic acid transporter
VIKGLHQSSQQLPELVFSWASMDDNKIVGYSWVVFAVVLCAQSTSLGLAMTCIPPFFTTIAREMNLTSTQVGAAWGMIGLGALLFSVLGGLISDRFGVRWTGSVGLLLLAAGGAMRGLARDYQEFTVAMFLFGAAMGLTRPNLPRALSQWFPRNRLGTVNGLSAAGSSLGAAIAMGLSVSTISPAVGGWRNIATILGGLTFLLAIAWIVLVKERLGARSAPKLTTVIQGFGLVLRSKTVWMLSIAAFLLFGHSYSWSSHIPGFFEVKYGMTSAVAGKIVSITLFSGVFAGILLPTLSDRIGSRKPAILLACIAGGLCNLLQGSFLGPTLMVILLIMPFGVGTIAPLLLTIPFELKELTPSVAGAAIGMIMTFQNLGIFVYPTISGKLIDLFKPNYYPYFGAQMMAFALTFLLVWRFVPETGPGSAKPSQLLGAPASRRQR